MSERAQAAETEAQRLAREAVGLLRERDSAAAVAMLTSHPPAVAVDAFAQAVLDLYWQHKDLPACLMLGRAGIQHGLSAAADLGAGDAALAEALRLGAKRLAYNLGSFAWPGWAEPGVEIGATDEAMGADAARLNHRLTVELKRGDKPMSNAHWLLGAYRLVRRELGEARAEFEAQRRFADAAGDASARGLAEGYLRLTDLLELPDDRARGEAFEALLREVAAGGDEDGVVQQLETARRVFQRR